MRFGLSDEHIGTIVNAIKRYPEIDRAVIFGSRAMGNYKPSSDIDIALMGDISPETVNHIWGFLNDEAPGFPYKVDVLHYETLTNAELRKHIDEEGKSLYVKRT